MKYQLTLPAPTRQIWKLDMYLPQQNANQSDTEAQSGASVSFEKTKAVWGWEMVKGIMCEASEGLWSIPLDQSLN